MDEYQKQQCGNRASDSTQMIGGGQHFEDVPREIREIRECSYNDI